MQMARGAGWHNPALGTRPLAGFSHGASGIAYALLELAVIIRDNRFRTTAERAIEYERSLFDAARRNWPDFRESVAFPEKTRNMDNSFMVAWCHGAPGIGLSRVKMLRHIDDGAIRNEIYAALETTLTKGFGDNHSLCHGDFGSLEFLWQAGKVLPEPDLQVSANQILSDMMASGSVDGWRCGVNLGVELPGLMMGIAGIGYGLLRAAEPARVPCVLALAPPQETS
jgi:lantibiotic modifying enzyme